MAEKEQKATMVKDSGGDRAFGIVNGIFLAIITLLIMNVKVRR